MSLASPVGDVLVAESALSGWGVIVDVNHRRLALLRQLSRGDGATVAELAEAFGLTLAAVRLHLCKLLAAGLVEEERLPPDGPGRPRNRYRTTAAAHDLLESLQSHSSLISRL